jgi:DNA-directed RNA polymerase subunit E'/Rpb7
MKRSFDISPKDLGPLLREFLINKVAEQVESTCDDTVGCIITIHSFMDFGKGRIHYGLGKVTFVVAFQCIVFRPEIGEILDVVVNEILHNVVIASAGPVKILINQKNLGACNWNIIKDKYGVKMYSTIDNKSKIALGTELRTKILGFRRTLVEELNTFVCVGTIDADYLGVLGNKTLV